MQSPIPPNAQFRNIKPRTRAEREGMRDREAIEKVRLKERSGGYHHYEEFKGVSQPEPASTLFISEADRFNKDFAAEEKARREQEYIRKQQIVNMHRDQQIQRDVNRWQVMENEEVREGDRIGQRRARWENGVKSNASAAYNPITLEYDSSDQGQALKAADDAVRRRGEMRMANLDSKMNSNYNILTGEQRRRDDLRNRQNYQELPVISAFILLNQSFISAFVPNFIFFASELSVTVMIFCRSLVISSLIRMSPYLYSSPFACQVRRLEAYHILCLKKNAGSLGFVLFISMSAVINISYQQVLDKADL